MERRIRSPERDFWRKQQRKTPPVGSKGTAHKKRFRKRISILLCQNNGKDAADENTGRELYTALASDMSFAAFSEQNARAVDHNAEPGFLAHAEAVSRGVILDESRRTQFTASRHYPLEKTGLALSKYLAFGETISLFDVDDLGIGPDWPGALSKSLDSPQLYPDLWPFGCKSDVRSPKILILD